MNESTVNKFMGNDSGKGLMSAKEANAFLKKLVFKTTVTEGKAWSKKVEMVIDNNGKLDIASLDNAEFEEILKDKPEIDKRTGLPAGIYDAKSASVLFEDLVYEAFTTGHPIFQWATWIPGVSEHCNNKQVSSQRLMDHLESIDGTIEVRLNVSYAKNGWSSPKINVWKEGSKPASGKAKRERVVRRAR